MDTGEMSLKKLMDVLKSNPRDIAAFKGLEEQYFLSHNWKQLSELYQLRADSIKRENPNDAAMLYYKSGELHDKRLGNKEEALLAYQQAFALHPQKKEYGDILANFYISQENWQKGLDILQKQLSVTQDVGQRIAILLKVAPIWKNRLQNRQEAKKCLQQVLDAGKPHEEAMRQLEELYYEDRQWDKLLELYQVRLSSSNDPNFRAKVLERCALLCQEELQDWPKAIQFYLQMLQLSPNNIVALRALENLYARIGKWDSVIEFIKRQVPLTPDRQDKINLFLKMANVFKNNIKNFAAAAECYEQILSLGDNVNVLKLLEETCVQVEDWKKLANVYERMAKIIPDKNVQTDLYYKIGTLARDRIQDSEMAIHWYQASYQVKRNLELLKIVQALLIKQNKTAELIQNYYEEIELVAADTEKLAIYNNIANIHKERKDLEAAAKVYEQVLQKYPQHMAAIENLKNVYIALEDYPSLVNTLIRESGIVSKPAQRVPIYLRIAEICKENLGQEKEAIPYYYKVVEIEGSNLDVWEKLRDYYVRSDDHVQLIKTLFSIIQVDPKRSENNYLEIARLYRDKAKDANAAVDAFKRVLATNSRNLEAIKSLAALYQAQNLWLPYVEMASKQLELTIDIKEQVELHASMCQAYRKLNNEREEERHLLDILKLEYDNKAAIAEIKELYTKQSNWAKYVQIWQKESEIFSWDDATLIERYQATAQIYAGKLNNPAAAIQYFEKARHLNANNSDVLDALEALYIQTDDDKNLVQILEAKAKLCKVEEDARKLYFRMGTIWEEKLQDKAQAILAFRKVADSDIYNMAALKKLANLYKACEEYEALADIYLREYLAASEPEQQIFIAFACGKIWEDKLHKADKAVECYQQVIKLDTKNMDAVERLVKIYQAQKNWAELAAMYQKKISLIENNEEIIRLGFELAAIYRDYLSAPSKAVEVYNDILSLDKANLQAVYALKELYPKLAMWEPLVNVLKIESQLLNDNEKKKTLFIQMAELCEEKLIRYLEAIQNYQMVLKLDTKHVPSMRALRSLYYKVQIPTQVIWTIDRELALVQSPTERVALMFEKGNLYWNQLQDTANAISTYEQILQIAADNVKAYEMLTTIYTFQKTYPELIRLWERQILVSPVEKQKELGIACAKIWEDQLKNDDKAQACLKDVLRLDAYFMPARRSLEKIYERLGKWQELLALYQGEIVFTKDRERLAVLYCQMAKVWENNLTNNNEAIKYYRKVLEIEPYNIKPIHGLQKIYLEEKRHADLFDAYKAEQALPDIERERRIFLHLACAEIQRFHLNEVENTVLSYQSVLDFQLDPNNLAAIRGLEDMYEQQGKYKELQTMLFRELELQKDKDRLIAIHLQLGSLMEEKLQDVDVAIEHFSEAHLSRPTSLPILRRLKTLLKQRERWPKYAEIVEKEIAILSSSYDLIPLHEELIEIYDVRLTQQPKAIEHGEAILQLDADRLATIVRLESLYVKTDNTARLVELYLQEALHLKLETARDRLIWLYTESGKLYMTLQKQAEAVQCFYKVIDIDPPNKESLSNLVKLLTALERWEDLIKVYTMAAQISRNKAEVETLYLKIGELWEKYFKNDQQALLAYQIVYSMNNKNLAAVTGMRKIFEQQQRWGDAVEFLGIETYLVEEKRQPALCLKMGEIWEEKLGMPHQALTCYLRVMGYGFHRATAERIMRIQQEVGDYEGLVDILKKDIRVTEKREELIPKLLTLGNILWHHINNIDEAVDVYLKVFKLQPDQMEAIECLEQLLPQQKKWKELVAILGKKRESLNEPDRLLELYNKMGEIYASEIHSGNMAIKYYEFAADIAPRDIELLHKLQDLYRAWGYYKKLIALNQKEIQLVNDRERTISLCRETGAVWEYRLFEEEQAMRAYEKLIELKPDDIESTRALARLYKKHQAWDKLIAVYKLLIEDAHNRQDKAEEIRIYLDLGAVYRDELADANSAIQAFSHIIEMEPVPEALASLEALYKSLGQARAMADLLHQKLSMCEDQKDRLQLYIHLGTLYEKELDDPDHAIEAFVAALELDPNRLDVLKEMDWLYLRKKKWEDLAQICLREFELISELPEKAELCYRLGIMHRDRFADPANAKDWFLKAIECQPDLRKAIKALTGLAILGEDWTQAVKYISLEIQYIKDPQEKVAALTDLGSLYQGKLRLVQKAKEAFQIALDIDPKSTVAVEAMADILCVQNEWAQAENLLGRLILLIDKQETDKRSKIYYKWGYAAEKLGKKDEAIIRYNSSLDTQANNLEALLALGNLYFERAQWGFDKSQWQEALNVYTKINQHTALEDKVEVLHRLAIIQEKLGVKEDAITNYRKVLRDHPDDMAIITALSKLHIDRQEYDEALKYLEMVVKSEASSFQERRKTLLTIADVQTKLQKHHAAIETFLKAFSLGVEDPEILRKLGELYMAVLDWDKAQEWLDKHYTCLENVVDKVANRCLIARILVEGRNEPEKAVELYREALAANPGYLPAIQGIAAVYEKLEKWTELAASYRSFLDNLPADNKMAAVPICLSLGNVYAEKLKDEVHAIEEFEKILALEPEHMGAYAALANIKAKYSGSQEEAIQAHMFLLQRDPLRVSSYRALYKISQERGHNDRAVRACRMLQLLDNLIPEEQKFMKGVSSPKLQELDPDQHMIYLIHNRASAYREVMALTCEHMVKVYPVEMEQKYGLKRKDRLTGESGGTAQLWQHAERIRKIMKIAELDIYLLPKKVYRIYVENTQPVSLIVGQGLLEASEVELQFLLAKHMFYIATRQVLLLCLEEAELKRYFRVTRESFIKESAASTPEDEALLKKINWYLPRKARKVLEEKPDIWKEMIREDFAAYLKTTEFAANRCGLMLTDNLEASIYLMYRLWAMQKSGKWITPGKMPLGDLIKLETVNDLVLYNISEEYGKLRKVSKVAL